MLFLVFVVGWLDFRIPNVLMFSLLSVSVADFVGWLNCEFQNPVDFFRVKRDHCDCQRGRRGGGGWAMPKIEDATLQGEQPEVRWGGWAHAILEIPIFAPWKLYLESIVILFSMKFRSGNFVEFLVYLVEAGGGRPPFLDLDSGGSPRGSCEMISPRDIPDLEPIPPSEDDADDWGKFQDQHPAHSVSSASEDESDADAAAATRQRPLKILCCTICGATSDKVLIVCDGVITSLGFIAFENNDVFSISDFLDSLAFQSERTEQRERERESNFARRSGSRQRRLAPLCKRWIDCAGAAELS